MSARALFPSLALLAALGDGKIAGAGLDVFEHEPNVPPVLFSRDDVVILPHIASSTRETRAAEEGMGHGGCTTSLKPSSQRRQRLRRRRWR